LRRAYHSVELAEINERREKNGEGSLDDTIKELEEKVKTVNGKEKEEGESKLRELRELIRNPPKTKIIFGPITEKASDHAGAISVGDAKILLFPVRSLKGVFAYVTCPLVLERFKRDLEIAGMKNDFEIPSVNYDEVIISTNSSLVDGDKVVLEDVILKDRREDIGNLANQVSVLSSVNVDENRIAIINNDLFRDLVKTATEIVARVKIDSMKGTVQSGALWYEEYLPSDCLLYSVIAIGKPKKEVNGLKTSDDVKEELPNFNNKFVQIGGNETVGKGFVKIKIWEGSE